MSCKKVTLWSFLIGAMLGAGIAMMNTSLDYRICHLKRKLNCLNRKVNRALNSMSEENLKKYKQEILTGYENIKNKIDNITIGDIKDKSSEIINNALDSINELKYKIMAYTK